MLAPRHYPNHLVYTQRRGMAEVTAMCACAAQHWEPALVACGTQPPTSLSGQGFAAQGCCYVASNRQVPSCCWRMHNRHAIGCAIGQVQAPLLVHATTHGLCRCVRSIAQRGVGRCWALCAPETPLVQPQVLSLLVFTLPYSLLAMTASNSHSQLPCQARLAKVPQDAVFESCPFKP